VAFTPRQKAGVFGLDAVLKSCWRVMAVSDYARCPLPLVQRWNRERDALI
jgi:hypothetical protein